MLPLADWGHALNQDGFLLLSAVFAPDEVASLRAALELALGSGGEGPAIRGAEGTVYAARNVLSLWPGAATVWHRSPLLEAVRVALGPECGLVRVLYFDKPPGQ